MIYDDSGVNFITFLMIVLAFKYAYMLFKTKQLLNGDVAYTYTKQETKQESSSNNYNTYRDEYRYRREEVKKEKTYMSIPGNLSRFTADLNFFTNCDDPYVLLNCSPNDTSCMIKKRYRDLVRKWHPDHIRGMGATQAELAEVTQIVQIINLAYSEAFKRAR